MIYEDVYWVDFDTLEHFMADVFMKLGVPEEVQKSVPTFLSPQTKEGLTPTVWEGLNPSMLTELGLAFKVLLRNLKL